MVKYVKEFIVSVDGYELQVRATEKDLAWGSLGINNMLVKDEWIKSDDPIYDQHLWLTKEQVKSLLSEHTEPDYCKETAQWFKNTVQPEVYRKVPQIKDGATLESKSTVRKSLFPTKNTPSVEPFDWKEHWVNMPEYRNKPEAEPEVVAVFKFKTRDDFEDFNAKVRKFVYDGDRVFDGAQKKQHKNTWYPLKEKDTKYMYQSTKVAKNKVPIYIISKGRYNRNPTSETLERMGVDYKIIVERNEYKQYCKIVDKSKILILPEKYKRDYDTFWEDQDTRTGPGPARNFAWQHSIDNGHKWHWVMDDNIVAFQRMNRNKKVRCTDANFFKCCEDFVFRYNNIGIAGPNYSNFYPANESRPAFILNTRIYSCLMIRNDLPFRWRGRYNEDTDLSLNVLKAGFATLQFNAFLQDKMSTTKMKGGNTDEFYDREGTLNKSTMLEEMHPDVAKVVWKFGRHHHHVDYTGFKNNPITLKKEHPKVVNNYTMELVNNPDYKSRYK